MAYDVGARIGIEGEKEFKQAVSDINKDLSVFGSELKKVTAQFDTNSNSMGALTAKSDVYNKQIDAQKQKIETLKAALAESADKFGENDEKTKNWQIALNKAETDLAKTENALENVTDELKRQSDKWQNLSLKMEAAGEKMKSIGSKLSSIGQGFSTYVTAPAVAAGVAAFKFASDMDEALNKVNVAFGNSAEIVTAFAEQSLESFGIAKGSALDMAALFGDMGTAMGLTQVDAANMSIALVGLAGDLASFKNIGIEQAQDALKGIFTGEGESLKSLGVIMQESTLEAYALANGYATTYKEMSQAEKIALRYAFVLDSTKNAQGDFSRTSDGAANQTRIFTEGIKETAAAFGELLLPIITPMIQKLNDFVKKLSEMDESQKKTILVIAGIAAAIGPVLVVIGSVVTAIGSIITIAPVLGAAIAALSGPVGVFIALLAGAVAAGIVLVKNWDEIKAWASEKWGAIKDTISEKVSEMKENVKTNWEEIKTSTSDKWEEIKTSTSEAWTKVKDFMSENGEGILLAATGPAGWAVKLGKTIYENWDSIKSKTSEAWGNIKTAISEKTASAMQAVRDVIDGIKSKLSALPTEFKEIGGNLIKGLWGGISDKAEWLWSKVSGFFKTLTNKIKDFFGIASPSKVFAQMGGFMAEGLGVGFGAEMKDVTKKMQRSVPTNFELNGAYNVNPNANGYSAGGAAISTNNNVNVYVQQLSEAQQDYLFRKFNARLGVV